MTGEPHHARSENSFDRISAGLCCHAVRGHRQRLVEIALVELHAALAGIDAAGKGHTQVLEVAAAQAQRQRARCVGQVHRGGGLGGDQLLQGCRFGLWASVRVQAVDEDRTRGVGDGLGLQFAVRRKARGTQGADQRRDRRPCIEDIGWRGLLLADHIGH